jgi:hypothetical protein
MKFLIIGVKKKHGKRKLVIQQRGAAIFHPVINTNEVLGNDILYGE